MLISSYKALLSKETLLMSGFQSLKSTKLRHLNRNKHVHLIGLFNEKLRVILEVESIFVNTFFNIIVDLKWTNDTHFGVSQS